MPARKPKEEDWREWVEAKIRAAGKWDEFNALRKEFQKHDRVTSGQCERITRRRAWKNAAALFSEHFDQAEYDAKRTAQLAAERVKRKLTGFKNAREAMAPAAKKSLGPLTAQDLDRIIEAPDDEVVIIAEGKEGDILRDTKWVYFNLARLIKISRGGIKSLDKKVLREAPSNGAVGLAQYALDDQKAFMEKFVTKILPKDEAPEKAPTEAELAAELDPSLDDLAKYMKRLPK